VWAVTKKWNTLIEQSCILQRQQITGILLNNFHEAFVICHDITYNTHTIHEQFCPYNEHTKTPAPPLHVCKCHTLILQSNTVLLKHSQLQAWHSTKHIFLQNPSSQHSTKPLNHSQKPATDNGIKTQQCVL